MIFAAAAAISGTIARPTRFSSALTRRVVEKQFAKLAHGQARERREKPRDRNVSRISRLTSSCIRIDQRPLDDLRQRQIGQPALRRHALAFRPRCDPGQMIAGLLLVSLGEKFAQIRKYKTLSHSPPNRAIRAPPQSITNPAKEKAPAPLG